MSNKTLVPAADSAHRIMMARIADGYTTADAAEMALSDVCEAMGLDRAELEAALVGQ